MLGDFEAAGQDILTAAAQPEEPGLEVLAETQRVLGRALAESGDALGAAAALERAARVLHAIGHLRREREVGQLIEALPAAPDRAAPGPPAGAPGPLAVPDPRVAARQAPVATLALPRPDLLLARAAAVIEQGARADLLGLELVEVLAASGCVSAAAVVRVDARGRRHAVVARDWTADDATAALGADSPPPLALGSWREEAYHLVVRHAPSLSARVGYLAVHRLASASIALAAARREARERAALWPLENPDDPASGMFYSEQMAELLRSARRIAATDVLVLLAGETGSGKDVLARAIHAASPRAAKPFIPFNCAAVPKDMLESQLFGHRRGAFTGAEESFQGVIRAAAGGTLFLDEIGEVTLDVQPKLLRFLDSREIHPLGEAQPVAVDVRIVAATNQDLHQLVREGRFRQDLYYRLAVIRLDVPPLRERREEIPQLVHHFLERAARESRKERLRLSQEALEYLVLYEWPGNVRQLANEMRRLTARAEAEAVIMPEHLDDPIRASRRTRPASERDLAPNELVVRIDQPLPAVVEYVERAMIQHAWAACHGRVEQVAERLGLSRKGLYLKRQRLGIEPAH